MDVLGGNGSKYNHLFLGPPKGTSLCETTSFDVLSVKIGAAHSRSNVVRTPPKSSQVYTWHTFSHILGLKLLIQSGQNFAQG